MAFIEMFRLGKDGSYTFDHVRNMRDVLRAAQITAAITFPIRAALSTSLESRENILWLLNQVRCRRLFQKCLLLIRECKTCRVVEVDSRQHVVYLCHRTPAIF